MDFQQDYMIKSRKEVLNIDLSYPLSHVSDDEEKTSQENQSQSWSYVQYVTGLLLLMYKYMRSFYMSLNSLLLAFDKCLCT